MAATVKLQAGTLRHYVTIKEKIAAQNEFGESTPTWRTVVKVWAHVRPLTARETERAKSFGPNVSHVVVMRYRTNISASMKLQHRNRDLLINGITDEGEMKTQLNVYCSEFPSA